MNLNKSREFFDPDLLNDKTCHIIGCGAIGSTVAENLARIGVEKFTLWDFDVVNPHNIANQMFFDDQIKMPKTEALKDTLQRINPLVEITIKEKGWQKETLSGYIFLCLDNIDIRRAIVEKNYHNPNIKAMLDFRMRLTDAQHYAAVWSERKNRESLLNSMQFTHEEAVVSTPVSACGTQLSVATTVRLIAAYGVSNFINIVLDKEVKKLVLIDSTLISAEAY